MADPTCGPWTFQVNDGAYDILGVPEEGPRPGDPISENSIRRRIVAVCPCLDDESAANARLIAVAPELLAACKRYLNLYDSAHHGVDKGQTPYLIRKAIAKAEGRDGS